MQEILPVQTLCDIDFSDTGNSDNHVLSGWSGAEQTFTWGVGKQSLIEFSNLPAGGDFVLELSVEPFVNPPSLLAQRLSVSANGTRVAETSIDAPVTLTCRIPGAMLRKDGVLRVSFGHPDGARPADLFSGDTDTRRLSVAFERVTLRALGVAARIDRPQLAFARAAGPVFPGEFDPERDRDALVQAVVTKTGLACAELANNFESLGNNCEFGFFQRWCGSESMGLFRFSNPEHGVVLREIMTNFANFGDEATVELDSQEPRREWNIIDRSRGLQEHTFIWEGDQPEAAVRRTSLQRLVFLRRMMIENMRDGNKIFVIKSGEDYLDRGIVTGIARALRQRGPNWLLWVVPGLQVGKVVVLAEGLLRGTIDRLTVQGDGTDPSFAGWLAVTTEALLAVKSLPG